MKYLCATLVTVKRLNLLPGNRDKVNISSVKRSNEDEHGAIFLRLHLRPGLTSCCL